MEPTSVQYAVLAFVGLMYGLAKTSILGIGILLVPIMLTFFTPGQALGLLQPVLLFADVMTIIVLRKTVNWRHVALGMPWALAGIILGWRVLAYAQTLPDEYADLVLRRLIAGVMAAVVVGGLAMRAVQARRAAAATREAATTVSTGRKIAAGILAVLGGGVTMIANNSGPVWVLYLMLFRMDKFTFLGTGAWLFLLMNLSKIPFGVQLGYITSDTLGLNAMMAPMVLAGIWLGKKFLGRISQGMFDNLVQGLALVGALYLLIRA